MKWVDHEFYALRWFFKRLSVGTYEATVRSVANHRRKFFWRRWFAWRPVHVPEIKADNIVVPAHFVWLEYVDCQRRWLFFRRYRPNKLSADQYEGYSVYDDRPYYRTMAEITAQAKKDF